VTSTFSAAAAKRIKLVVLDVDGVLTDGGIVLGDVGGERLELKRYDIQDGLGIKMLQRAGIRVAVVTGRVSKSVELRARELGIDDVIQDEHARKVTAVRRLAEREGIAMTDIACVGDDLPDLGIMREVGLPAAVANATPEAMSAAQVRLTRAGGAGAVREFAELLLRARGEWDSLVEWYVKSRDTEGIPA
jgi:3-deoxy-D-manno-octulosonate 8-phosphate phosphatase (KDO 8-P phosphatase)